MGLSVLTIGHQGSIALAIWTIPVISEKLALFEPTTPVLAVTDLNRYRTRIGESQIGAVRPLTTVDSSTNHRMLASTPVVACGEPHDGRMCPLASSTGLDAQVATNLGSSPSAEGQNIDMSDSSRTLATLPPALASVLRSEYRLHAQTVERVSGGFDPAATLWRVGDGDGRGWAVKATQRDCRYGLALASAVSRDGFTGVVAPRLTRAQIPWSESGKSLISVSRWIDGDDAMTTGLASDQWTDLGKILRVVHEHRPPRSITPVRRGIKRTGQHARNRLRKLDQHFASLSMPVTEGDQSGVDWLTGVWHEHRSRIMRLDRKAQDLKALRTQAPRVPCHGDPHLGNVLLDEHGHPWLIDLDEATTAHREIDMVLVEFGVLPSRPIHAPDRHAFWSGYGMFDLDETRLTRFGCIRALEDVTSVFRSLITSADVAGGDSFRATLHDLLGPKGLIALVEERLGNR